MKAKATVTLLICGFAVMLWLEAACSSADQPKSHRQPSLEPKPFKTDFVPDAQLTAAELKQVLSLAEQGGITNVGEVSTFHYLPGASKGISVKSVERVDGRNVSFESVEIHKTSWGGFIPGKEVKRDGDFWFDPGTKYVTLLRRYEFNKHPVQVWIIGELDIAFADKVIPLIAAKKVRIENDYVRQEFESIMKSKPNAIQKRDSKKDYELQFDGYPIKSLVFEFKEGEIVVTGVTHTVI